MILKEMKHSDFIYSTKRSSPYLGPQASIQEFSSIAIIVSSFKGSSSDSNRPTKASSVAGYSALTRTKASTNSLMPLSPTIRPTKIKRNLLSCCSGKSSQMKCKRLSSLCFALLR